jgi:hypothetical protein
VTQTNQIYEDLIFRDAQATPGLKRVSAQVSGIGKAVGGLKSLLGGVGGAVGLAGIFGVAATIKGVGDLYGRVSRLKTVTGVAAAEAHGLIDAFEMTGADSVVADQTIQRLAVLAQRARGGSDEATKLRQRLGHIGVDLKHGLTNSLLSMSAAVKSGRLGVSEMARTFKVPMAQAAQLMGTLRKGPEHLRAIMRDTAAGADVVDEAALESFQRMKKGKFELLDAWDGLVATLYKQLLPGITAMIHGLKSGLDAAQPVVEGIGRFLASHMDLVVASAKAYLGYLVAARAVAATTGGGSLGGLLKGQLGGVLGFRRAAIPAFVSRAQGMSNLGQGLAAAGQQAAIRAQYAGRGGGLAGAGSSIAQTLGSWSPMLGKLASSTVSIRALGMLVTRLGVAGIGVALAVKTFQVLKNDIGGHRSRISQVLADIAAKFEGMGRVLRPVAALVSKAFGSYMMMVVRFWLTVLEYWLKGINLVLTIVKAIADILSDLVRSPLWAARNPGRLIASAWERASASADSITGAKSKGAKGGDQTEAPPYMDFRGSKFTIENNFAEGFDIGRVSVAITEGIAATGQRRLQSGLTPLYAIRGR